MKKNNKYVMLAVGILIFFVIIEYINSDNNNDPTKNIEEKNTNSIIKSKGHARYGDMIDYCPLCGEKSSQAYLEAYGQILEQGQFCLGCEMVCYSCAKKMQQDYRNGYSSK